MESIHILVDITQISQMANLVRELSLVVIPHLVVMVGTHPMVKEIPPNVIYVSQLLIGHKIVLTKSKMNMIHIIVTMLYCSSQILIIHLAESWNAAVLDCGASKTVCAQAWFDTCIETHSNEDKSMITYDKSNSIYQFGDGKKIQALKNAKIPVLIGSQKVMIDTDIVSNEVQL